MVSPKTRAIIWAKAAGRCEYPSCNASLIGDLISGNDDANFGLIAHVVADKPGGPRGDPVRSALLSDDPANLMLLCYNHHKLIDVDALAQHPETLLLEYKTRHEERVRIVTEITEDKASHVLLYGANIGEHASPLSLDRCRLGMLPERYPADGRAIAIQMLGTVVQDREQQYWATEPDNLNRQFDRHVRSRLADGDISHLSVFGLAPIPLLVQLGALLGDITPLNVYQLHREPAGWKWARDGKAAVFRLARPTEIHDVVAISLGVSATVVPNRIEQILGKKVSIWSLSTEPAHNDVIRDPGDLQQFRQRMRSLLDEIKATHQTANEIHVFAAVPVSIAVELGRIRMPKADMPFLMYDETKAAGFVPRLRIG
jgi:hypothetical protein